MSENASVLPIFVYKSTDSTNMRAKEAAGSEEFSRAVFVAERQTRGRGRLGRSFSSKRGKGLYLSLLTEGGIPAERGIDITTYMAVTARDVLAELTGLDVKIKWVNDLYVNGKKVGGILTEGETDADGMLKYAICGIGINLKKQKFDAELQSIATTVEDECGASPDINTLLGKLISRFYEELETAGTRELADRYRAHSTVIGRSVTVIKKSEQYPATVTGINDRCMLELLLPDGSRELLSTGEVSLRL